jgi:hypothetical protein
MMSRPDSAPLRISLPYWLREFTQIRVAAVTFAGTLGIAGAAVFASYWHMDHARKSETQAQAALEAARSRLEHAETEKSEIRLYQPQFLELRRKGLIGEERRLDWVEAIRQIQEQRRLLPLSYEIEPQQPYSLETRLPTGDYQLRGSRMALRMELLHELDLFHFLTDLRQAGTFTVQDCAIRRTTSAGTTPLAPSLNADCTLNWVTLTSRPAAPVAVSRGAP